MSRHLSTRSISSKSMHAFLSNSANRQTDRQTNEHGKKHLPPPLSEVIIIIIIIIIIIPNGADHVESHADTVSSVARTRDGQTRYAVVAVSKHLDPQTVILLQCVRIIRQPVVSVAA